MTFISAERLHFAFCLSIGLLSLPLLTECEKIRLVGPSRCAGRLEIYNEDTWGTVCDDHWSLTNAEVVCRELNCGTVLEAKRGAFFGEGQNMIWLDDVQCTGSESSIIKCPHRPLGQNNCGHAEDAGVICSDSVRLYNGTERCSGRVEVYHGGQWGKVCNSNWRNEEASVVCKELDCGSPKKSQESFNFGDSGLRGYLSRCSGNVSSIAQCSLQESTGSCEGVSLSCSGF